MASGPRLKGFSVCQFLWHLVPQSDTWREEGIFVSIGPAVWYSVLVLVTFCSSTQKLEVRKGWYSYHGMYNTKHHNGLGLLSSVSEGFPRKVLGHGSDTAGVAIVSCHKSGGSPLDSFYLFDVVCCVWIKDCGPIFHLGPHKCSVTGVLDFLWVCWLVSS